MKREPHVWCCVCVKRSTCVIVNPSRRKRLINGNLNTAKKKRNRSSSFVYQQHHQPAVAKVCSCHRRHRCHFKACQIRFYMHLPPFADSDCLSHMVMQSKVIYPLSTYESPISHTYTHTWHTTHDTRHTTHDTHNTNQQSRFFILNGPLQPNVVFFPLACVCVCVWEPETQN